MIKSLNGPVPGEKAIGSVELLGAGKVQFSQKQDGLHIQVPAQNPGKYAYVYKIEFR